MLRVIKKDVEHHIVKHWIESHAINPLTDKKIKLLPYQNEIIDKMFTPDGQILKPHMMLYGIKKCGKTAFSAMIAMFRLCHFRNNQIVCMANNEDQAFLIYNQAIELFKESKIFKDLQVRRQIITHKKTKSELRVLTKSRSASHGRRIDMLICDEVMEYDSLLFQVRDVLAASMTLSKNAQQFILANVPQHSDHYSLEILKQCKKDRDWQVREFRALKSYAWTNPKAWEANPMYNEYKQVRDNYKKDFKLALIDKNKEVAFKRYHLGLGCSLDSHKWIDPENLKWVANPDEQEAILQNREIIWCAGFDLNLQGPDSSSFVLCGWIPNEDDTLADKKLYMLGNIYYGNISRKQKLIKDKIIKWHNDGLLTLQKDVSVIQHQPIIDDFTNLVNDRYPHIGEEITCMFDPAYSQNFIEKLQENFTCKTRTYSPKYMTRPIRYMQRLAELKNIYILEPKNEAICWQASNGVVSEHSRNFCSLKRLGNNSYLNLDFWAAGLESLSELLEIRPGGDVSFLPNNY